MKRFPVIALAAVLAVGTVGTMTSFGAEAAAAAQQAQAAAAAAASDSSQNVSSPEQPIATDPPADGRMTGEEQIIVLVTSADDSVNILEKALKEAQRLNDPALVQSVQEKYDKAQSAADDAHIAADSGDLDAVVAAATNAGNYAREAWEMVTAAQENAPVNVPPEGTPIAGEDILPPSSLDLMLSVGSTGSDVKTLQNQLNAFGYNAGALDGEFGATTEAAVKAYQKDNGLYADGIAGPATLRMIYGATDVPQVIPGVEVPEETAQPILPETVGFGANGSVVFNLQRHLSMQGYNPGEIDGIYGQQTEAAVRAFQQDNGLYVDGIAGPQTYGVLLGVAVPEEVPVPADAEAETEVSMDLKDAFALVLPTLEELGFDTSFFKF